MIAGCNSPEFTLEKRTYMVPESYDFPVREWLNNGWILKISNELFWVGGFLKPSSSSSVTRNAKRTANVAEIWTPDFFEASLENHRQLSAWSMAIGFSDLEKAVEFEFKNQTLATSLVSWKSHEAAHKIFDKSFELIQTRIAKKHLKKAVPWIFLEGQTATNNKIEWLARRIRFGLRASKGTQARLYGRWDQSNGYLGLTPEDLLSIDDGQLRTMAVAGTKAFIGPSDSELSTASNVLLTDEKERSEHRFVVEDLEAVLKAQSVIETLVVGETEVRRFSQLLHLVTPIQARLKQSADSASSSYNQLTASDALWKIVEALHPTPALGTAPRDSNLSLLREIETLQNVSRRGFGAPFSVKMGNRLESVVAIRQFRWNSLGPDLIKIEVGSGCGIVKESQLEKEWQELSTKRSAVLQAFGLSPELRRPLGWSVEVLNLLIEIGVRRFVVCAGARNAPLVVALNALTKVIPGSERKFEIQIDSFFEERSAAFFAMGLSRASGAPVAVVTTSGTAVTELQSAMAEADFSGVPLIALTADRPKRLRATGAPQSIDQSEIFARFSEASFDLEEGDGLSVDVISLALSCSRPIHINMCFEEPLLIDRESLAASTMNGNESNLPGTNVEMATGNPSRVDGRSVADLLTTDEVEAFREALKRRSAGGGVVIVGSLNPDEREPVVKFILRHQIPCLLEATSGLRRDPRLSLLEIKGGDRDLQKWIRAGHLAQVFRFGGIPTSRVWRDLDDPATPAQTFSVSKLRFAGMGRGELLTAGKMNWNQRLRAVLSVDSISSEKRADSEAMLLQQDQSTTRKLDQVLLMVPQSEPSFVRSLSELIPPTAIVYVGNSLPIRWWDWVASRKRSTESSDSNFIYANRGVNGIDGQISTALGIAAGQMCRELWIIVGDLTALYDLSGLWAAKLVGGTKLRVVVINNSGGQIFRQVLKTAPCGSAPFENTHSLKFKNWAAMWGFSYEHCSDSVRLSHLSLPDRVVMELEPDSEATEEFWKTIE